MPRYFFDVKDGERQDIDREGQVLDGLEVARRMAMQELVHVVRDEIPDGDHFSCFVTVRDEEGSAVYVATSILVGELIHRP